jgi:UDP-GlcNAc:undecaprenyl-phosphate GlcNAc-1-phosphate transferase
MVPVLVLGLPIFDTALVTISRLRRRLNPLSSPGRDHISHRLVAAGMSRREAVLTLYIVSFALGLLAIFVTRATVVEGYIGGGAAALVGLFGLWRMERSPFFVPEIADLKPRGADSDSRASDAPSGVQ